MPYEFYKVLHIVGMVMAVSGLMVRFTVGVEKWKKPSAIVHGIGLAILFVAGFGLMARIGIQTPWPLFIYLKLGLFLVLGGLLAIGKRKPEWSGYGWAATIVVVGLAAYLAITKPGL